MQYANYIPFSRAAQPFPYPEHFNFPVLIEGILYEACRCTVLQEHGMHRNKCHGEVGMAGVWELTLSNSHLYICLPIGKPSPPSLGLWISELSAGRRALGPGDTSYLRYQGLGASTVDTQALFLIWP